MKEKLLYLCHRIPYPPNKGDKIAAYHILTFLSKHYDVYLGCFIDDPEDRQYRDHVKSLCKTAFFVDINPRLAKLKGISALLTNQPITLPYYANESLSDWVENTINENRIEKAFLFSGCMAQFVIERAQQLHTVMHFVDVDSDKWKQYAAKKTGIMKRIYHREHITLERYEKQIANTFEISCFVTETETQMFRELIEEPVRHRIQTLSNGIDTDFFSPVKTHDFGEEYAIQKQNYIVFTGAMDYWANVDAVKWFVSEVWPAVRKEIPDGLFYIVGSSPDKSVYNLQNQPGVVVTGRVEDVRPYLKHAKASVAPMQIARGIQNKILEAMSMAKPVAASSLGIEGIEGIETVSNENLLVSDSPSETANWVIQHLASPHKLAEESRLWMQKNYSWEAKLAPVLNYLEASGE
ncbi:TIGR03087 family PEP-CTERM/XrtA system glycosyltransferase [Vibrio hannami]|uniref:TIGR03087 family PEP-CTERM/XrtA system glycosyltransferase n=1 Tax=Vibrio hannami TaxID=2717094 RepID=UPI00240F37F5|nr:TIGR03087 family PEP-CTERM/XrtA system glycosyltransferase [Vibrio hannami]MDG3088272.1 TIGR03087 family PEP-CTERM/XrtA system glycosyltransferase [Vibrio hannami]